MKIKFELTIDIQDRRLVAFWDNLGINLDELTAEYEATYEIKEIERKED